MPDQAPTNVLGNLEPGPGVGTRPCIPTQELRVGDSLFAAGYRHGQSRIVHEIRHVAEHDRINTYVRVSEGWYRWNRIYVNVKEL